MKTSKARTAPDDSIPTTVGLPKPLWQAIKIRAVQERKPMRDVYRRALEAYLKTPLPEA